MKGEGCNDKVSKWMNIKDVLIIREQGRTVISFFSVN